MLYTYATKHNTTRKKAPSSNTLGLDLLFEYDTYLTTTEQNKLYQFRVTRPTKSKTQF